MVDNGRKSKRELEPAWNSGLPFFVVFVLSSDKEARDYFRPAGFQSTTLSLRKRNVIAVSIARLDPDLRKRRTLSIKSLH
jgi:hypothetical protein